MSSPKQDPRHNSKKEQDGTPPEAKEGEVQRLKPLSTGKAVLLVLAGLVLAVVLAVLGIVPRLRAQQRLQQQTTAEAPPDVIIAKPTVGKPEDTLLLPGALQAFKDSPVYARTSGYLSHWYVDIGAHVKEGQLLAVIQSPEVDQQLAQAKANLATAQANANNAAVQAQRYKDLLQQDAVSQQDTDNFVTGQASTYTQVEAAQHAVSQFEQLVGFERVYAPFTGIITARNIDEGQLINAGAGANQQLFEEADIRILRVYVSIPQVDSLGARRGTVAQVMLAEYPGQTFTGHIVRSTDSIDPNTRTMLVEIDVDNKDSKLMPGAYGEVRLTLNTGSSSLIVPVPTMVFRAQGLQIATVENGKAKLVPITIGQDDGRVIQVVSGLTKDSNVIQNPPDSILDGEAVHVVQPQGSSGSNGPQSGQGGGNGKSSSAEGAQPQTGSQQSGSAANDASAKQEGGGGGGNSGGKSGGKSSGGKQ